jgi:hypothetical protein
VNGLGYVLSAGFGGVFGTSELITRYRDKPGAALLTVAGLAYVGINAAVSVLALGVTCVFGWSFGLSPAATPPQVQTVQVLVTGFAAMTVLRSAIFTVRVGNQDVGIGFNAIVQAFLRSTDAAVDRGRGVQRDRAARVMDDVSFDKAKVVLPSYCLGLMQNLSKEDEETLGREVARIATLTIDNGSKSRLLGLAIVNVMGDRVLQAAVASLGEQIAVTATTAATGR